MIFFLIKTEGEAKFLFKKINQMNRFKEMYEMKIFQGVHRQDKSPAGHRQTSKDWEMLRYKDHLLGGTNSQ